MFFFYWMFVEFFYFVMWLLVSLVIYIIGSIGYYLLFRKNRYEKPWIAFIPLYNEATFLQKELILPEFTKWIMTFYFVLGIFPKVGPIITFVCHLLMAAVRCMYIERNKGDAVQYILAFLFPVLLPYMWLKNGRNMDII